MAKMEIEGLAEYSQLLSSLSEQSEQMCKEIVYAGAEVIADSIKDGLRGLPVDNNMGSPEHPSNGITRLQKSDLIESMGIAPIESDPDSINTKIGFDGYGSISTKKYPNGVPNQMLMRSVESGTSFRRKTPVVRRSVNKVKQQAETKMETACNEKLKEIMEE